MEAIIVALIGLVGIILTVLIEKGRKENKKDHGVVEELLIKVLDDVEEIDEDIKDLEVKLDKHIIDHSEKNKK